MRFETVRDRIFSKLQPGTEIVLRYTPKMHVGNRYGVIGAKIKHIDSVSLTLEGLFSEGLVDIRDEGIDGEGIGHHIGVSRLISEDRDHEKLREYLNNPSFEPYRKEEHVVYIEEISNYMIFGEVKGLTFDDLYSD
jgi:hypothetical protein